ncbi:MAG TPA: ATP-binding protein [Candidatus Solibacter sp.]|nr:ATP-binding protein [Candidatus Solibacter sp.]
MIDRVERGETLVSRLPLSKLSFRWQIALLGTLVCVLFLSVLFAAFATLKYTKSAVLSGEKKHLISVTQNLAREYDDKADFSRRNHESPPLNNPTLASSREVLALLSRVVLQTVDGVKGGYYAKTGDTLIGDSFSVADPALADSSLEDEPPDQRADILETAKHAAETNQGSERILSSRSHIILVEAVPIRDNYSVVGSAWTIKRLSVLPGANRFRAYLITVGLGLAALASVLMTLLVIHNLQGGVRKIEGGLRGLEENLSSQLDTGGDPEEIQRIAQAINRLGIALQGNIEREKRIEGQLRHSERLASLGRLVAGVAHEVRNPLATIRLRVQMCRRDSDNPHVKESCAVALEEIERLNGMVNRLINFARPVQLHYESADLRDLIEQRMESFREWALRRGVTLNTELPRGQVQLHLDKDRMAQVFDNVIQNALEAMSEGGGTLSVTLASHAQPLHDGNGVCVEFRDTGKGMNSSVARQVFDPFFTTKPSGTGLGLSICHELVEAHGGAIQLESEEGRGTSVRITIPASHS